MQRYVRGYREDRIGERPFPYPILGGGNVLKMVERAKRGVRSNRSLISHRFHAWCCQAAVLVAVAIPVFTTQLEKSREATDQANLRAAYAEQMTWLLTWNGTDTPTPITVNVKQTQDKWQSANDDDTIKIADGTSTSGIDVTAKKTGTWSVSVDTTNMKVTIS